MEKGEASVPGLLLVVPEPGREGQQEGFGICLAWERRQICSAQDLLIGSVVRATDGGAQNPCK